MTFDSGSTIGGYRVVRKIGEGGMGAVYLAQHTLLGRSAAIKVLLPALSSQREVVERFFNEARATTSITDPGIVQVFDFGFHTDGSAYIVMELLDGESLDARLQRGPLSVVDALRITRQVASSLAAAHARGIVHRDLKPDNLYMVRDPEAQGGERPKILDFGIAKLTTTDGDRSKTRTGTILGTPVYMSPEQCRGAGTIDHRSDIYSLGCVLYHLICGRPPFDFEGIGEIISAHLREPAVAPSRVAGVPVALDELVLRCLEKQPEQRYASMIDLARACEALLARISGAGAQTIAVSTTGVRTPTPTTLGGSAGESSPVRKRAPMPWLAMGAVLVAATIGIVVVTRGSGSGEAGAPAPAAAAAPVAAPPDAAIALAIDAAPPAVIDAAVPAATPDAAPAPPPPPSRPPPVRHHAPPAPPAHNAPTQGDPYDVR